MIICADIVKRGLAKDAAQLAVERYGMALPTSVEFHVSEKQFIDMQAAKALMHKDARPYITDLTMCGNSRRDPDDSFIILFNEGREIEVKQYDDGPNYINCFDCHSLSIMLSASHGRKFSLSMFYCNEYSELDFETVHFELPDVFEA